MKTKRYMVVLTNGCDYQVRATTKAQAIANAKAGKGRQVGVYFQKIKRAYAEEI